MTALPLARRLRSVTVRRVLLGLLALLVLIQLVPYGRDHADPRATQRARWQSARAEKLFSGACGDCHSDNTTWPIYSNVAPVSWLVENDVKSGREHFNVSEWDRSQPSVDEAVSAINEGEMPPLQYKLIHSSSRLSAAEKKALIDGLRATYAADPPARTRP
jgi:mono/diheme cytochrome c family protein